MTGKHLHHAVSKPRFQKYLLACSSKQAKALKLYRANLILSQRMYAVVGVFEVVLRNAIDTHMKGEKGEEWMEEAVEVGGYLEITTGCEDSYHSIHDAIHKLGKNYSHDALVAKLTFGFWTYQFAAKEFAASGSTLLQVFPKRPFGTKQKDIFKNLIRINDVRNRIAHYEPVCFDKGSGTVSTLAVERRYELIKKMLQWMGYDDRRMLYGVDQVRQSLKTIQNL